MGTRVTPLTHQTSLIHLPLRLYSPPYISIRCTRGEFFLQPPSSGFRGCVSSLQFASFDIYGRVEPDDSIVAPQDSYIIMHKVRRGFTFYNPCLRDLFKHFLEKP